MRLVLAAAAAALFGAGVYLILRRNVVRVVWGLALLTQGTNLYLLSSGAVRGAAPIVGEGHTAVPSDPLPQALILTAIVIGFGLTGLALVLVLRVYRHAETLDVEEMTR